MLKKSFAVLMVSILLISCSSKTEDTENKVTVMENFTLADYNGVERSLADYQDSKATVVMFIATRCPVSNDYNARMAALYNDYQGKGFAFIGINSNKEEDVEEISKHAQENGLDFHILKDANNIVADKFKASVTPEIYVLNSKNEVLYHGRIDDSRRENEIKTHDLKAAFDEILAGKPVSVTETKAFGCTIKRVGT